MRAWCSEWWPVRPLGIHWSRIGKIGNTLDRHCQELRDLPPDTDTRLFQAGDFPSTRAGRIDPVATRKIAAATEHINGFAYTHHTAPISLRTVRVVNARNRLVVNLSANGPEHADRLVDSNAGPVVTGVPGGTDKVSRTPKGRRIVVCPAQIRDTNCKACRLCMMPERDFIVGFLPHGSQARNADAVFRRRT